MLLHGREPGAAISRLARSLSSKANLLLPAATRSGAALPWVRATAAYLGGGL